MQTSIWLLVSVILTTVDQVSKFIFEGYYPELVHYNHGSAFSLPLPQLPVIVVSFAIMYTAMNLQRREGRWYLWALLFAGAFGNLIDRLAYGYVIDFIDLGFWPVFNIADIYLSLAGFLLVWFYVIKVKTNA